VDTTQDHGAKTEIDKILRRVYEVAIRFLAEDLSEKLNRIIGVRSVRKCTLCKNMYVCMYVSNPSMPNLADVYQLQKAQKEAEIKAKKDTISESQLTYHLHKTGMESTERGRDQSQERHHAPGHGSHLRLRPSQVPWVQGALGSSWKEGQRAQWPHSCAQRMQDFEGTNP
jgi:hypothetical protein